LRLKKNIVRADMFSGNVKTKQVLPSWAWSAFKKKKFGKWAEPAYL